MFLSCLIFLLLEISGVDIWVQDHFYNFQSKTWLVDAHAAVPRLLFYNGPKVAIWLFGLSVLGAAMLHKKVIARFPRFPLRRDLWVVIGTLVSAPALVALGKATTNTFTPSQIYRYGGSVPYVKVIGHYPSHDHPVQRGRAFPAGHASGGFALLSLAGLATTRRGRIIGTTIGLLMGSVMGIYQMLKGAHYLSHTLVTAMFCWIVFLSWRRILPVRSSIEFSRPRIKLRGGMRILIIEDHTGLRESLTQYLQEQSYVVDASGTGDEGLWYASEQPYDVILLDLMLPKIDGMEILRKLRQKQVSVYILVISARDGLEDRLEALNGGADDYLTKPFPMAEALARINALIRRKYSVKDPVISVSDLRVDTVKKIVHRGDSQIELTALEYRLLEYLTYRRGELVSRTEIWEHVFEDSTGGNSNAADVYIGYLRKKLNSGDLPNLIHTRRGQGFILGEEPS
ncbi:response regulator [Luteolibacter algae]|uniref:response regulator n=1 Tax=Luteolibacter algae TaxID=454151 RepID=UPI0036DA17B0